MTIPLPHNTQFECRNETLEVYASDRRGTVLYQFNNLGYRNNIDYEQTQEQVGIYIGSSLTSGIGVDWNKSFVSLSSEWVGAKGYHFAHGCLAVDHNEIARMLQLVKQSGLQSKYFVLQFIDLNRIYDPATGLTTYSDDLKNNSVRFLETFDQIDALLHDDTWCFLGCDNLQHELPNSIIKHPRCVSWNTPYIDLAGVGLHPGVKWHKMIALGLTKFLRKQF